MIILREDQEIAIQALRDAYAGGLRRIMMQAPTGMGKTVLAGALVRRALELEGRILFTVPAISLINQTVQSFISQGITDVGVIQADHSMTDPSKPVQIASVSTLMRRPMPEGITVAIIDEAHRWYEFYQTWMTNPDWADIPIIGLSATPWTKGLGKYYQKLIVASTTAKCIEAKILSPFKVFAPSHPDLSKVRTVAGDYHEGDLSHLMQNASLVADVVETWVKMAANRPTLCFAVDCDHARVLQAQFKAAGVTCEYQDANTPMAERDEIKARFHTGRCQVVCNVGTLTTGVDWDVRCISMARPTKSEMLFVQIIGRGLRTAPGKDHCLILDHSDNHSRLGFVTDINYTTLNDGKTPNEKDSKAIALKPRCCPECQFMNQPRSLHCQECGFVFAKTAKDVEQIDGELVELVVPVPLEQQPRAQVYAGLLWIVADRGYKPGWAAYKYKELYGMWPNGLEGRVKPLEPTKELMRWVRKAQKAWKDTQPKPAPRVPAYAGGRAYNSSVFDQPWWQDDEL